MSDIERWTIYRHPRHSDPPTARPGHGHPDEDDEYERIEVVPADQLAGAVRELRALMEAADEEARSQYEAPARLREAILRADRWLTASGSSR